MPQLTLALAQSFVAVCHHLQHNICCATARPFRQPPRRDSRPAAGHGIVARCDKPYVPDAIAIAHSSRLSHSCTGAYALITPLRLDSTPPLDVLAPPRRRRAYALLCCQNHLRPIPCRVQRAACSVQCSVQCAVCSAVNPPIHLTHTSLQPRRRARVTAVASLALQPTNAHVWNLCKHATVCFVA
jgi:hypothetical protein